MNRTQRSIVTVALAGCFLMVDVVLAQGPPPMRRHTANQARDLSLIDANRELKTNNRVKVTQRNGQRVITVNNIPEHEVGRFPNSGNPHSIKIVSSTYRVPMNPKASRSLTPLSLGMNFGVARNGIAFDPGAAEFWQGNMRSGWQYEPLGGAIKMGLDENHAHVQPDGRYHYHGLPDGLLSKLGVSATKHSPLVGWAADGFPIYARYGYSNPRDSESPLVELRSGYRLKSGQRPSGNSGPGGNYDGTFVEDYEYYESVGDLDECNGRFCITPEFPNGTYAYFLTENWPTIPRMFRGTPDASFR